MPGKQYSYRVQMVLADPNLAPHVKMNQLDPKVIDRIRKLAKGADKRPTAASTNVYSPWSAPRRRSAFLQMPASASPALNRGMNRVLSSS